MRTGSLLGAPEREVELGNDLRLKLGLAILSHCCLVSLDDLDAEVMEEDEERVDLVRGEVDLLQHVVDVFGGQVAVLAALGEELVYLLDGELA